MEGIIEIEGASLGAVLKEGAEEIVGVGVILVTIIILPLPKPLEREEEDEEDEEPDPSTMAIAAERATALIRNPMSFMAILKENKKV